MCCSVRRVTSSSHVVATVNLAMRIMPALGASSVVLLQSEAGRILLCQSIKFLNRYITLRTKQAHFVKQKWYVVTKLINFFYFHYISRN